jgi:cellulase/cellobiase CelA1
MIRVILSAAAVLVALSAAPADAECSQANAIFSGGNGPGWVKCTLIIGPAGAFGGTSRCTSNMGQKTGVTGHVTVTNGANCTFTGALTYSPGGAVNTVDEATMAQSHDTIAGVGLFSNGFFVFNMVKAR